jgi:hypothetical protein
MKMGKREEGVMQGEDGNNKITNKSESSLPLNISLKIISRTASSFI